MALTSEQKQKYITSGAQACPYCERPDISGGQITVEGQQAWQEVSCAACDGRWRDVYTFAFVETDDELVQP